jgi:hypothetical protein
MTITTPTGELLTDLALFVVFTVVVFAGVAIDSARRVRRGKWD